MAGRAHSSGQVDLDDVGRVLLRRWRTVLASILVFAGLALATFLALPREYSATTTLVVTPLVSDPSSSGASRDSINIATEREIVQSREVARLALTSLGRPAEQSDDLVTAMDVVAPDGSQVLRITVASASAQSAADLSNAVAEAYLEFRRLGGQEVAQRLTEYIDERLTELSSDGATDNDTQQVRVLTDQRRALALYGQDPGRIIGRAAPPESPTGPGVPVFLLAGLMGGAIVGAILALMREQTDPLLRSTARYSAATGMTPIVLEDPAHEESLRWLRRSVVSVTPDRGTVLLLSASKYDVRLAQPFADVAARSGTHVVVEDVSALSAAEIDEWTLRRGTRMEQGTASTSAAEAPIQIVDATGVASRTSISELADRADVVAVIATPRDRRTGVVELLRLVEDVAPHVVPVLVRRTQARRSHR